MHPQTLPCTSPGCTSIEGNGVPFNISVIFKTYGGHTQNTQIWWFWVTHKDRDCKDDLKFLKYNNLNFKLSLLPWMSVVNTLFHSSFSNKYLFRYNSDPLDYQCPYTTTIPWTIIATTNRCDLVTYRCQHGHYAIN